MSSLKNIFSRFYLNKEHRQSKRNKVFEIPHKTENTVEILVPNIQNKKFKISKWFIKVGKIVRKNQVICELESNSVTIEFDSQISGKLVYITDSKDNLKAGDLICKIETS